METKTRFDLAVALDKWRQELTRQTALTADDRHELETHLLDSIAELRRRDLSDEECFWLARRRLGPADELEQQFLIADPGKVWRERAFWLTFGLFALQWLGLVCKVTLRALVLSTPEYMRVYTPSWWMPFWSQFGREGLFFLASWVLPSIAIILLMRRGHLFMNPIVTCFVHSRWRLVTLSAATIVIVEWLGWYPWHGMQGFAPYFWWTSGFRMYGLLAVLAWLFPGQSHRRQETLVSN